MFKPLYVSNKQHYIEIKNNELDIQDSRRAFPKSYRRNSANGASQAKFTHNNYPNYLKFNLKLHYKRTWMISCIFCFPLLISFKELSFVRENTKR